MKVEPVSPYSLIKYTGERYSQIFSEIYGLQTVFLRYFNIFGPRQDPTSEYSEVVPKFIKLLLEGKRPIIFGDGGQSRDFTYVDNIVKANILAAKSEITGEVINISCGERRSVNELVETLNKILEVNYPPIYKDARLGEVKHSLADISKAEKLLGYKVDIDFTLGLKRTIEFYKQH